MKKLQITVVFLFVIVCFNVSGDIVMTGVTPRVKIYVSLLNPDKLPGYKIIGLTQIMIDNARPRPFIVEEKKYYHSQFIQTVSFVAVKESYLNGKNLNDIDWQNDKNVIKPNLKVHPADHAFSNHIENMKIDYTVIGFTDTSMVLHRSSDLFQFRDKNRADSICKYEYKGDLKGLTKTGN